MLPYQRKFNSCSEASNTLLLDFSCAEERKIRRELQEKLAKQRGVKIASCRKSSHRRGMLRLGLRSRCNAETSAAGLNLQKRCLAVVLPQHAEHSVWQHASCLWRCSKHAHGSLLWRLVLVHFVARFLPEMEVEPKGRQGAFRGAVAASST